MVPAKNDKRWEQVITGQIEHKFRFVPAAMIFSRLGRKIKKDNSPENLKNCIDEIYTFCTKYENVFQDDLEAVLGSNK